ncbi:AcrR family transcriptional regulator [Allocatelliglobosispora scoriae]|uniref:AcrR family transcriptional regulator n=1 Tax=Allocatelliglobosispora scoriae TaxID=643052 RepID=A0A841C090_9ACTN|nr:TetR/AcrR family transcriptional regulator [Allocatelliglobosispora scoriae]MBB5872462.1 AcrR family transcriptional regulator [Allocatelliglobosispora scoriae]
MAASTDPSEIEIPASIAAAWGLRERSAKGPKRGLTLERIVTAAVGLAVAEGLGAVSMGRVAAEVQSSTMGLYRYVTSKDELLALMTDQAIGLPPETLPELGWREGLERWAWAERAAFHRHPWALRVPISGPPITPHQIAWMEEGLTCLRGTGLTESEKLSVILLLSGYVRNEATTSADIAAASSEAGITVEIAMSAYGRLLKSLIHPKQFPSLSALIAEGVLDKADDPDEEFIFGLARILDGVGVLVTQRAVP